jgi:RecJ-like exonuclease
MSDDASREPNRSQDIPCPVCRGCGKLRSMDDERVMTCWTCAGVGTIYGAVVRSLPDGMVEITLPGADEIENDDTPRLCYYPQNRQGE